MKREKYHLTIALIAMLFAAAVSFWAMSAQAAWETPTAPTTALAQENALPAPGLTATISNAFYKISATDIGLAVAQQLESQGVEQKAEATLTPGSPSIFYSSDHAIQVTIHTLQVDPQSKHWQAQVYFVANGKTESVKPISGTYAALIDVPVATRQLSKNDVIEQGDLEIRPMAERLLRKDTITDPKQLIGLSPKNGISPNRPIHSAEITQPVIVKKGDLVEMAYDTPYIHIKTAGTALEDGAKGATIRTKNQKSQIAVSVRVEAPGRVSVNDTSL